MALRCDSFGDAWKYAHIQTLNIMSGRDKVIYKKYPIIPRYFLSLTGFSSSSLSREHDVDIGVANILEFSMSNLFSSYFLYLSLCINVPPFFYGFEVLENYLAIPSQTFQIHLALF